MFRCEDCSNLILEYLYGLLEPEEEDQLRAHLANCPACQQSRNQVEKQQRLLARAALIYSTIPPFAPPSETAVPAEVPAPVPQTVRTPAEPVVSVPRAEPEDQPSPVPATVPLPAVRRGRRLPWLSAGLAAAVLLAVTGLSAWYQQELRQHRDAVAAAEQQVRQIDARFASLSSDYLKRAAAVPEALKEQQLQLQVHGPVSYSPSAPSKYRLTTRDLADRPVQADVQFRITSGKDGEPVLERRLTTTGGEAVVEVPAGLALPPDATLEVQASTAQGSAQVQELLQFAEEQTLTHLALNKNAYYTGEVLFFRSLTLERFSLRPLQKSFPAEYVLLDSSGKEVRNLANPVRPEGIGGGEFALTQDLVNGEYTLEMRRVAASGKRDVLANQRIQIWHDPAPELEFDRMQYRPGDRVAVQYRHRRLQQAPANQNFPFVAKLIVEDTVNKEKTSEVLQGRTDHLGNAYFHLQLPAQLSPASRAQLEFECYDGTRPEKLVQTIPVLTSDPMVEVFPEGGQLVAGLRSRVYFRVRGTAVDRTAVAGVVTDSRGQTAATFKSTSVLPQRQLQDRTGVFELTPRAGERYQFRTTAPAGVALKLTLPEPAANGVVLELDNPVAHQGEPIRLTIRSTRPHHNLLVVSTCRGRVVDQRFITASVEGVATTLEPVAGTRGVIRLTVYEPGSGTLQPLAERLLFRQPAEQLHLAVQHRTAGKATNYNPGEKVRMEVQTSNEKQQPADAWLLLAVVEESALGLGDYRQTQGLPAHFLLTTAVRQPADLEDAGILLAPNPASNEALDHFLATAGWRRFVRAAEAKEKGTTAQATLQERLLIERAPLFRKDNQAQQQGRFQATLTARLRVLEEQAAKQRQELQDQKQEQVRALMLARGDLANLEEQIEFWLRTSLAVFLAVLLLAGLVSLALGLWRVLRSRGIPTGALATACCCLLVFLVVYQLTASWRIREVVGKSQGNQLAQLEVDLPSLPRLQPQLPNPDAPGLPVTNRLTGGSALFFAEVPKESQAQQLAALPRPNLDLLARNTVPRLYRDLDAQQKTKSTSTQQPENNAMTQRFYQAQKLQRRSIAPLPTELSSKGPKDGEKQKPTPFPPGTDRIASSPAGMGEELLREFAYWHPKQGVDHQDTLLWHPALKAHNGRVEVQFDLPNTISAYRILILGHTSDGRLGHRESRLQVRP